MLEVAGGIETKWEIHRGSTHLLGLWTLAPEKVGCLVTPGEGRSWTMLNPDLDSHWTGWKVGLCEKSMSLLRTVGSSFIRKPPATAGLS